MGVRMVAVRCAPELLVDGSAAVRYVGDAEVALGYKAPPADSTQHASLRVVAGATGRKRKTSTIPKPKQAKSTKTVS